MNTTNLIKLLVVFEVSLVFMYLFLSPLFEGDLPIALTEYSKSISYTNLSLLSKVSWWLTGLSFFAYLLSVVLLLLTKPIGKWLYIGVAVVTLISTPFFGHVIEHAYLSSIGTLGTLTQGVILGLLFCCESEFNKLSIETRSPGSTN